MLVLSRKATQQIQIGDNIVVTIVQVKGQGVRIGIEAPDDVRIVRSEIAERPADAEPAKAASDKATVDRARPRPKPRANVSPAHDRRGGAPGDHFSAPHFSLNDPDAAPPIGESSGLFPRLRQRAARPAPLGYCPTSSPRVTTNPSCSIIR